MVEENDRAADDLLELDGGVPVAEASRRLGISTRRVRALIEQGDLAARQVGHLWLVDIDAVNQRARLAAPNGRAFSPARAWGLLFLADGQPTSWLDSVSRSKLKARLRADSVASLGPRLTARAFPEHYRAHPSDLPRIAHEDGLMVTGGTAAAALGLGLIDPGRLDAYVTSAKIRSLQDSYGLRASRDPNLILRRLPDLGTGWSPPSVAPLPAVALDLVEDADPRLQGIGARILEQLQA